MQYVVKVEANNLVLSEWAKKYLGHPAKKAASIGCFATRVVDAVDQDAAMSAVVDSVRKELSEKAIVSPLMNDPSNPMTLKVNSVRSVAPGDTANAPDAGFTFFPEV